MVKSEVMAKYQMRNQDQEDLESEDLTMVVPVHFRGSSAPNRLKGSGDPNSGSGANQRGQDQDGNQEEVMEMSEGEMWMRPRKRKVKKMMQKDCCCCQVKVHNVQQGKRSSSQFLSDNQWMQLEEEDEHGDEDSVQEEGT